jgi:hypothetical protein
MKTAEEIRESINELDNALNEWDRETEDWCVTGDERTTLENARALLWRKLSRQKTIEDMRKLLDFFEVHEELPLPWYSYATAYVDTYDAATGNERDPEDIKREARNITHLMVRAFGKVEKEYDNGSLYLKPRTRDDKPAFGNISLKFSVPRKAICRKVVTGTKVIPATEAVEVEVVDWICEDPVLA